MNIYLPNGYVNFGKIRRFCVDHNIRFIYMVGGRGIGKTYGFIESFLFEEPAPFMFLRRTQKQADIIGNPQFNPFNKNAVAHGTAVYMKKIEKVDDVQEIHLTDDPEAEDIGPAMGYTGALSTFSNVRGFNADGLDALALDEFIPERHERPIKNEASAFFNAYETINRNRELQGRPPLMAFCMANSNDLGNPIFMYAGHVQTCLNMRKKGQDVYIDFNRHYMIILLDESPISKQKESTVLYEYLGKSSDFAEMSLSNVFHGEKDIRVVSRPLREYDPIVTVSELTVYRHKGGQLPHYCTFHRSGACPRYGGSDTELKRFSAKYGWLYNAYLRDRIEFEDYGAELLLQTYFKA